MKRAFSSFEEALDYYLREELGHGANTEIAKRLIQRFDDDKKEQSWAVQIGKWRKNERKIQRHNQDKINAVLNVRIQRDDSNPGVWRITSHKKDISDDNVLPANLNINAVSQEIVRRIKNRELSELSDDLLVQVLSEMIGKPESTVDRLSKKDQNQNAD